MPKQMDYYEAEKPIDAKYKAVAYHESDRAAAAGIKIEIIKSTGDRSPIPEDEPMVLFRARDRLAIPMLYAYRQICQADRCTKEHLDGIDALIETFEEFRETHPGEMKQPGITRGL